MLKAKCTRDNKCTNILSWPAKKVATYCLARILVNYKNFFEQKSAFKELLLSRGHKCLFLPKFYCELNLIKMY
jgi:hypothetical protein